MGSKCNKEKKQPQLVMDWIMEQAETRVVCKKNGITYVQSNIFGNGVFSLGVLDFNRLCMYINKDWLIINYIDYIIKIKLKIPDSYDFGDKKVQIKELFKILYH